MRTNTTVASMCHVAAPVILYEFLLILIAHAYDPQRGTGDVNPYRRSARFPLSVLYHIYAPGCGISGVNVVVSLDRTVCKCACALENLRDV